MRRRKPARPRTLAVEAEVTLDTALPQNAAVEIRRADRTRVASARRLDAFDALRDGMAPGAYDAVRALERWMTLHRGEGDRGRRMVRIDGAAPRLDRTDRMIAAGERVRALLAAVGDRDAWLLSELIEPTPALQLKPWREVVRHVTGETHPHAQGAAVRAACANLARGSGRSRTA